MKTPKRKRRRRQDHLVMNLLIIVALVLVVFEGRLILTMTQHSSERKNPEVMEASNPQASSDGKTSGDGTDSPDASSADSSASGGSSPESALAGLPLNAGSASSSNQDTATRLPTVSNPESPAIVQKMSTPVDDSYFADAVFIGDSRMEGFRNASGITQGQFFTSVGMSLSSMTSGDVIQTPDGNITVAAALSGGSYNKIYIMLGTNDLGEYDWDAFREGFISVTRRFQEIQPDAVFYICSVIYVEESKVTTGDYINNTNVDKINSILLDICEETGYHYLDLNEFLSNGYGSLIEGATSDGVHIYPDYCKEMLDYLKSHYVPADESAKDEEETAEDETETEDQTEKEA